MTNVMRKAYTEIDEVLKFFPQSYIDKIPKKILNTFKELKWHEIVKILRASSRVRRMEEII